MGLLDGKTALITGGSHGIGLEIALAFAREGAKVAVGHLPSYDESRGAQLSEALTALQAISANVMAVAADVSDEEQVLVMFETVQRDLGGVDILVNNAGFVTLAPVEEMPTDQWDRMIAVHLRGTFLASRAALPHMLSQGSGRIINVASQIGQIGKPNYAHYAAAKGGIIAFTKALARETANRGVLVNCIAPGPVRTGIVPALPNSTPPSFEHLPIGRVGQPSEIAPTAVFLASEASSFYVGQTLGPNGGEVML